MQREREREITPRSHHKPRAQSPSTSHASTSPFNFDFESHPDRTLRLCRRTQSLGLHAFNFPDFAPFDLSNFTRLQLRSTSLANPEPRIAPITLRSQLRNGWVLMNLTEFDEFFFCWVLFLCLSIEKWYYIFVWMLRKCEEQEENVFSILFSTTQSNTRKYFLKHFLECNQTLENIFLS